MTVLDSIGNTPLFRLEKITEGLEGVTIYAKAEYFNPSGSVKDRAAKSMVAEGIRTGRLSAGKTILDATSGNTGIAYAMIGAALGYRVALCMPANANFERKKIIKAYNATIIETDPLESSDGAFREARRLAAENPGLYFYPDQYNNPANWKAHYNSTAPEIWRQTEGRITHFVAGMGTSGTFTGTARRLKEFSAEITTVAMQPDSPLHGLEGMKHMASTIKPGFLDPSLADETVEISTDEAQDTALTLARKEGLFVGISSGGNVAAALKLAKKAKPGSVIVTILCDGGSRYLSDELWEREE